MYNAIKIEELFDKVFYKLDDKIQRPYEWDENLAINLINDIQENSFKTPDGRPIKYDIGTIITYQPTEDSNSKVIYDAQQRIATATLMLASILKHTNDRKIEDNVFDLLFEKAYDDEGFKVRRKRLSLLGEDDIVLYKILNKKDDFTNEEKKNNLFKNYTKLTEQFVKGKSDEELSELFKKITRETTYSERKCECEEEAIRQFNALNGSRKSLKPHIVAKSYIYEKYKEKSKICDKMEEFFYILSNMEERKAKEFYGLFCYYYCGSYKEQGFQRLFKETYGDKTEIVNDVYNFYYGIYQKIIKPEGIYNHPFFKQASLRTVYLDLYGGKYKWADALSDKDKEHIYKCFEWGYVSNAILNANSNGYQRFKDILPSYDEEKDGDITEYVTSTLRNKNIYTNIEELRKPFNEKATTIPTGLLLRIEEEYTEELNALTKFDIRNTLTLEHIDPQKWDKKKQYNCSGNKKYVLGNFTIIGNASNSSNSNKPAEDKRQTFKTDVYRINNNHLCDYEVWDDNSIDNNTEWYIELLKKYYSL